MTDKLNWQGFRSSHKLSSSKKEFKSLMWIAYKADDREGYKEAAELAEFEIPEEVKDWLDTETEDTTEADVPTKEEETEEETTEEVTVEITAEVYLEYSKTMQQLQRFPHAYDNKQKIEMHNRLEEIAQLTRPDNYKCTATDGWQIWFGPTQHCLLINTTRHMAFTCSRAWWTKRYLNAGYVHRQLVHDAKQIDRMKAEYEIRKKLIKRAPLPGVEIMLPTTASEYVMRS